MFDIADQLGVALAARLQQFFQLRLALAERQCAKIFIIGKQQIEGKEDQIVGLAIGDRRLQR